MKCIVVIILFLPAVVLAAETHPMLRHSGLPIPRFVSLKSDEINVRVGPGRDYPIKWMYRREGWPVEVIGEFGHWRHIRDRDGSEGWIHSQLLSGVRFVLIQPSPHFKLIPAYADSLSTSRLVMEAEPGAMAILLQCRKDWCQLEAEGQRGWIEKRHLWGVYAEETLLP